MTSVDAAGSNAVDVERLEKIVEMVTSVLERQEDLKEELKAIMASGKSVGFDMAAVKKIIALRDEEKRQKFQKELDAIREYADILGDGDPTNAI